MSYKDIFFSGIMTDIKKGIMTNYVIFVSLFFPYEFLVLFVPFCHSFLFVVATCPYCGHGEAAFREFQTRSADEPATLFYRCLNEKCQKQWRED